MSNINLHGGDSSWNEWRRKVEERLHNLGGSNPVKAAVIGTLTTLAGNALAAIMGELDPAASVSLLTSGLRVFRADGSVQFEVGQDAAGESGTNCYNQDGSYRFFVGQFADGKPGIWLAREDNKAAFIIHPHGTDDTETWWLYDRANNVVMAEAVDGQGLARPHVPLMSVNALLAGAPSVSNGTWTDMQLVRGVWQHLQTRTTVRYLCSGTAIGEVRVWDQDNSAQYGPTVSLVNGGYAEVNIDTPNTTRPMFSDMHLAVQARVASGAGTVTVASGTYGRAAYF